MIPIHNKVKNPKKMVSYCSIILTSLDQKIQNPMERIVNVPLKWLILTNNRLTLDKSAPLRNRMHTHHTVSKTISKNRTLSGLSWLTYSAHSIKSGFIGPQAKCWKDGNDITYSVENICLEYLCWPMRTSYARHVVVLLWSSSPLSVVIVIVDIVRTPISCCYSCKCGPWTVDL